MPVSVGSFISLLMMSYNPQPEPPSFFGIFGGVSFKNLRICEMPRMAAGCSNGCDDDRHAVFR